MNTNIDNNDTALKAILEDYMTPIKDDGFSDKTITAINMLRLSETQKYKVRIRLYSLYGAAFLGGVFTALNAPSIIKLWQKFILNFDGINHSALLSSNLYGLIFIGLSALVIWVLFDNRLFDIL